MAEYASVGSAGASLVAAVPDAIWATSLPEDPNNTVYEEIRTPGAGSILSVSVMAPALGTSAGGTYTLDVTKTGVSVLTGTIDLLSLVAGTWSSGVLKVDGTEDFAEGDELRVSAASNNANLAGYTDGLMVVIAFAASGA